MEMREDEANNTTLMLYEASMRGCVATLNTLIRNDPFILHKISLTSLAETPLHISALLGHLDFTRALLGQKPELVTELDSCKRTPLHLASAEGHKEIVQELLEANKNVCLFGDQEGRIPLHLAAMRGRVEVIKELIRAKPESVRLQVDGESALHLCVRYNHLGALKLLVEEVDDEEVLNSKNLEGNTILNLAAKLKQLENLSYLLSVPKIRASENEIQDMLIKVGVRRGDDIQSSTIFTQTEENVAKLKYSKWIKYLKHQGNWVEESQGMLMLVATVIATVTFQAAISPPGGLWEENIQQQQKTGGSKGSEGKTSDAGTTMLAGATNSIYQSFIASNTISFLASLSVIFLVVSGFPLKNKFFTAILMLAMCTAVSSLAETYITGMRMVTPDHVIDEVNKLIGISFAVWTCLLLLVGLFYTILFLFWLVKKLQIHVCKILTAPPQQSEQLGV